MNLKALQYRKNKVESTTPRTAIEDELRDAVIEILQHLIQLKEKENE